jgi:hypothetical protein
MTLMQCMQRTQLRLSTSRVSSSFSDSALVGQRVDDVVDDVLAALALDERLHLLLVDLHVVAPGADHGHVGALDRVHAVVRAARDLELELVRQRRTVHVVDEVVHQQAVDLLLVGAGLLAARRAHAGHAGAHARAGAAEIPAVLVDLVEEVLGLLEVVPMNMMLPVWPWKAIRPEPHLFQESDS